MRKLPIIVICSLLCGMVLTINAEQTSVPVSNSQSTDTVKKDTVQKDSSLLKYHDDAADQWG